MQHGMKVYTGNACLSQSLTQDEFIVKCEGHLTFYSVIYQLSL